jgi:hypothetical protein
MTRPRTIPQGFPKLVCLCGSTRLMKNEFVTVNRDETLKGNVVVSVGVDMRDDFFASRTKEEREEIKDKLDCLHRRKIDLADEVIILKVKDQELGESTSREKTYAENTGKPIRILEFPATQCLASENGTATM